MLDGIKAVVEAVELNDARLEARLQVVVATLAEHPEQSLPQACGSWTKTLAAYRFFANPAVDPEAIRTGLAKATAQRCQAERRVLVVQDTTSVDYTSHRSMQGRGPLEHCAHRGFFIHTALALSPTGVPQGIIDQQVWARDPETVGSRHTRKARPIEGKETAIWLRGLRQTEARLGPDVSVLTVADREADVYELFALAQELHGDWLIRARHDRVLAGDEGRLLAAVEPAPVLAQELLALPRAGERQAREATVAVRSATVTLRPPRRAVGVIAHWWAAHPKTQRLAPAVLPPVRVGIVLVTEVGAPAGVEPLRWLLLTSLPVETVEQALTCVADYRLRWLVERYHFVLKSGCQVERLQLRTADAVQRALAVYVVVAWWLLWLTYLARVDPQAPCTVVLEPQTWQALWATQHRCLDLPDEPPDLHTALCWIAELGGFLARKGDGEPGVQTLWRGLRRLHDIAATWSLLSHHPVPSPP